MVSILMPVKNAAEYLDECIQSIIEQSWTNWELIAVDDHSSDSSKQILEKFAGKDQRIIATTNKGQGIIPALRTAYAISKGEYIHRMDADDIMPKQKILALRKILDENGKRTVATGRVKYFSANGVNEGYLKYEEWLNSLNKYNSHWDEIYKECVIASPCWMVHRNDFETCGSFDSNVYPEDYDLIFRFYENKMKVVSSPDVLHLWRDHPNRISRNHEHYAAQSFYELKLDYFLKLEYNASKMLVIWGAGKKGKRMAKLLQAKEIAFLWASNNPNKHGKEIYDQLLYDITETIKNDVQLIITVAQRNAKKEIRSLLQKTILVENKDFWFFS